MADLIVFCENPNCGTIFTSPNVIGGSGSARITFENTRVGPCPKCGGTGLVPDGVYNYSNNAIRFLTGPKLSVDKLRSVEAILRKANRKTESKESLLKEIARASPDAASALKAVPDQNNWLQWLAIVIALVSLAIQIQSTYFKADDKEIEKKFIEHLLKETKQLAPPQVPYERPTPKVQRNDPCPCGSGRKFKKCCLQTT